MSSDIEIKAMGAINDVLSKLDEAARTRVLAWAYDKHSSKPFPVEDATQEVKSTTKGRRYKKSTTPTNVKAKKKVKKKSGFSMVKDFDLMPKGKKSFKEFIAKKQPKSNQDKCMISVYYLKCILNITVSVDHVFTCFKNVGWPVPELNATLKYLASHKALLDTSSLSDIKMTRHGENLVEHELPRKPKGK